MSSLEDLSDHGAKAYARMKQDETPLYFAARNNNVEAIHILINNRTQMSLQSIINMQDSSGNTPLFMAYNYRSREAIAELLKLGANPFLKNAYGVSVNGEAHYRNREETSGFNQFVLNEIAKHFKSSTYYFAPPSHCAQPLIPVSS